MFSFDKQQNVGLLGLIIFAVQKVSGPPTSITDYFCAYTACQCQKLSRGDTGHMRIFVLVLLLLYFQVNWKKGNMNALDRSVCQREFGSKEMSSNGMLYAGSHIAEPLVLAHCLTFCKCSMKICLLQE